MSEKLDALKEEVLLYQPYFGSLLSAISIKEMPLNSIQFVAGIGVHPKFKNLVMYIREDLYTKPKKQQVAIIVHELYHVVFAHMSTPPSNDAKDHMILNMAMDMSINQEIPNLPEECIFPERFNLPKGLTTWQYYELLKKDPNLQPMDGHDGHEFGEGKEFAEACKDALLKADQLNKVTGRTCSNKTFNDNKEITLNQSRRNVVKEILRNMCKISLQSKDLEKTYARESRRYRDFPGNVAQELPRILVGIDTSGSISDELIADGLNTVLQLSKAMSATVEVVLWNTTVYAEFKIKNLADIQSVQAQSGGTDIADLMQVIGVKKPDLAVVLTDGQFPMVAAPKGSRIVWVLSEECAGWNEPRTVKGY